ncbi:MAG TPA: hypothetical protein VN256_17045 [Pyrinomonadaceae bacterium]|nr:hypothetical protein [Pyrinomonadaceae bacterium]
MRPQKHWQGFIVFTAVLGLTVLIYDYLNWPPWKVHRTKAPVSAPAPVADEPHSKLSEVPRVSHTVRLVSLDFINGKSYTTLTLQRETGRPAPERLWVTTVFLTPESAPGRSWTTTTEIRRPFGTGNRAGRTEITAEASCSWCAASGTPAAGYFARVYVWTEDGAHLPPPEAFAADITTAVPVVVQAERETRR